MDDFLFLAHGFWPIGFEPSGFSKYVLNVDFFGRSTWTLKKGLTQNGPE